ncbi:hypothetical protein [Saccharopolyspora shandongensis]|uniref:hypothetical protein n=1 Tax=Saccharopolyspora shandongensis TaxID=418495 RepID=UPI0033FBD3EE
MQTQGGQAAADAITSRERHIRHVLLVDWNGNGQFDHPLSNLSDYVTSTSRDQTISSTTPEDLLLVEGSAAATLDVVIAGEYEGRSLASHMAPYNPAGAFYATGITLGVSAGYWVGVWTASGWVDYPQFYGVLRDVTVDIAAGEVRLQMLDNAELMRAPVDLPAYAMQEGYLQSGWKRGQLCDSSSLIDLAARAGGFTMGPDPEANWPDYVYAAPHNLAKCLSVPFHGSLLAEIGTVDRSQGIHKTETWLNGTAAQKARAEAYMSGPHGYLAKQGKPTDVGPVLDYRYKYWIDELGRGIAGTSGTTFILGGWFYWAGPDVDPDHTAIRLQIRGHRFEMAMESSNGAARVQFQYCTSYNDEAPWDDANDSPVGTWDLIPGPYTALPSGPGWHYYQVIIKWYQDSGDLWMNASVDDRQGSPVLVASRQYKQYNDRYSGLVWVRNSWGVSDVNIWHVLQRPPIEDFVPSVTPVGNAAVSWGRNRETYTLRESFEAWELAKDVAAAEFGAVFFDESGKFHFWNYDDIEAKRAMVVREFTADDVDGLSLTYTTDSVRNVWDVTTQSARMVAGHAYDFARDGVPLTRNAAGELIPADFTVPYPQRREFFFYPASNVQNVKPERLDNPNMGAGTPIDWWDTYVPVHAAQWYSGASFVDWTDITSEQKFDQRDRIRFTVYNGDSSSGLGFVDPNGAAKFRIEGAIVEEDEPRAWRVTDKASADRFGARSIQLDGKWLQDEFQTSAMLDKMVARAATPIPTTDAITVPGDPRIQLGDTIIVRDPNGAGPETKLQILGIRRSLTATDGLTDTYQVEVILPPREGIWDSGAFGVWDQSFIWA